jgi:hypothetical protein
MGKFFNTLTAEQQQFLAAQHLFFVATAPTHGRVNVSPKGMDTFRVLSPARVAYLDFTGSGSETSAHLIDNGRITLMFCAFSGAPLILRMYGRGRSVRPADEAWPQLRPLFGPADPGERQIIDVTVESVQTSCGFGVPFFEFSSDRTLLHDWAEKKGADGLAAYRAERNRASIDGLPTGLGTGAS